MASTRRSIVLWNMGCVGSWEPPNWPRSCRRLRLRRRPRRAPRLAVAVLALTGVLLTVAAGMVLLGVAHRPATVASAVPRRPDNHCPRPPPQHSPPPPPRPRRPSPAQGRWPSSASRFSCHHPVTSRSTTNAALATDHLVVNRAVSGTGVAVQARVSVVFEVAAYKTVELRGVTDDTSWSLGWSAEKPPDPALWERLASGRVAGGGPVQVSPRMDGAWLLWLTDLPDIGGAYNTTVAEVSFRP